MINFLFWIFFSVLLLAFTLIRSHPYRFTRFLAFDSLLGLIFLNADHWFVDPFSGRQIVSWIFLAGSLILAVHGFTLIKTEGNPTGDFEDTTNLITRGACCPTRFQRVSNPRQEGNLTGSCGPEDVPRSSLDHHSEYCFK